MRVAFLCPWKDGIAQRARDGGVHMTMDEWSEACLLLPTAKLIAANYALISNAQGRIRACLIEFPGSLPDYFLG